MKPTEKQKMCPHCEGRIPLEAEVCTFCAQEQTGEKVKNSFQTPLFHPQSLQESLTSLYTPPYSGKKPQFSAESSIQTKNKEIKETPMYKNVTDEKFQDPMKAFSSTHLATEEKAVESSIWPTIFMVAGSNFLVLGLLQFFFSDNGVLKLQWDGNYWFIYCLAACPLLYFGVQKIKKLI